jgi:hypothetical protein
MYRNEVGENYVISSIIICALHFFIRVTLLRKMGWNGHFVQIGEMKYAYTF